MARIVVVEDSPAILELLKAVCLRHGHEVHARETAQGGLDAVREWQPDVVLLDRKLGEDDALPLVRHMRGLSPQSRVIMVTGYTETQDIVQAMRGGAHDYVTKPFDDSEIIRVLDAALASPAAESPVRQKLVIVYPKHAA